MRGVLEVLPQSTRPMAGWANTRVADELEVRRLLKGAGIEHYYSSVVTSVDAGSRKPAPEFFRFALGKGGVEKDSVLFVCHQLNTDVLGARRNCIRPTWLSGPEFHSVDET